MDYRLNAAAAVVAAASMSNQPAIEITPEEDGLGNYVFTNRKRIGNTQGARTANYDKRRAKAVAGRKMNVQRMIAAKRKG